MNNTQNRSFDNDYMPYIIKWGKITCWVSIPLILIPCVVLIVFYRARISFAGFMTALIPVLGSMLAWYIVDPISLFPVLHVPGLYMTYIAGNSKEIRAPAAIAAMSAADVEPGTHQGTAISCVAIATSVFVSLACLTFVAVCGKFVLDILPKPVISSLNFLLPALYGALAMQRIMLDYRTFFYLLPITVLCVVLGQMGAYNILPLGGGYAKILILVVCGSLIAKFVHRKELR